MSDQHGVLVGEPWQPKSEKPTSPNSTARMLGAPCSGCSGVGHHGLESVMVLPMVRPNAVLFCGLCSVFAWLMPCRRPL